MLKSEKLSFWNCDHCKRKLRHGEMRYNCVVCDDYDNCDDCVMAKKSLHPHCLVPEIAYGPPKKKTYRTKHMKGVIESAFEMYSDRHCLGTRDIDKHNPSIYLDSYSWLTFNNIGDRSKNFGHGLRNFIQPRGYLSICASNRPEWIITDFACIFQSIITVPIYTLFNDQEIVHVINNTNVSVVVCDKKMLSRFLSLTSQCPSLEHIICMDPISEIIPSKFVKLKNIHKCIFYDSR